MESILSGLAVATDVQANQRSRAIGTTAMFQSLEEIAKRTLQLGGKATVGYGLSRIVVAKGKTHA